MENIENKLSISTVSNRIIVRGFDRVSITQAHSLEEGRAFNLDSALNVRECLNEPYYIQSEYAVSTGGFFSLTEDTTEIKLLKRAGEHQPKHCEYFLNFEAFSNNFVDEIIQTAINTIRKRFTLAIYTEYQLSEVLKQIAFWPKIKDFTIQLGAEKLMEYINNTADSDENWVYSVALHSNYNDNLSNFYRYEVMFSLPNKCYPIPQATASIFFIFEVSRVKSPICHVDVKFQLEGFNMDMIPGRHVINDALLFRVLDAKIAVFKKITF